MTPLEAIRTFQEKNPEYKELKMSYAGRLDPLAEGVLLVLTGDELKEQKKYWGLDKQYEADILFGFSTDTYDVLGIPSYPPHAFEKKIPNQKEIQKFQGNYTFTLPPYSSHKINGKPLFWWARNNKLDEIEIPRKTVKIYKIELREEKNIKKDDLLEKILEKIDSVQGDFRQKEIKEAWKEALKGSPTVEFPVLKIIVNCSSGTYIRSIANELGEKTGTEAVLLNLKRTRVGEFMVENSIRI